jgi:hypothetical protein
VFTVPANSPLGCAVPLTVQINNNLSNTVMLPVAAAGNRTCTPVNPAFNSAQVALSAGSSSAPFTFGQINFEHEDNFGSGGTGFTDTISGTFIRFTIPTAARPFFFADIDEPPVGTCQTFTSVNGPPEPRLDNLAPLNPGQLTVQGPNGSKTVTSASGDFQTTLSSTGAYLSPGQYTVTAPGGQGVSGFTASLAVPAMPVLTSPAPDTATPFTVTRSNGLTLTWSGGTPSGLIEINGSSATDNSFNNGASFRCLVSAASGTFTIPASVLLPMPPANFGLLTFEPFVASGTWSGSDLDVTAISARFQSVVPLSFR